MGSDRTDLLRRLRAKKGAKHDGETVEKAISLGFPASNLRPTPLSRGQRIKLRRPRPSRLGVWLVCSNESLFHASQVLPLTASRSHNGSRSSEQKAMNILTVNLLFSTFVFRVAASIYVIPKLADLKPRTLLLPILLLHAFRHLGLMFLTPGATMLESLLNSPIRQLSGTC